MKKILIIFTFIFLFTSCTTTFRERRRAWTLDCIKDIGNEIGGNSLDLTESCLRILESETRDRRIKEIDKRNDRIRKRIQRTQRKRRKRKQEIR